MPPHADFYLPPGAVNIECRIDSFLFFSLSPRLTASFSCYNFVRDKIFSQLLAAMIYHPLLDQCYARTCKFLGTAKLVSPPFLKKRKFVLPRQKQVSINVVSRAYLPSFFFNLVITAEKAACAPRRDLRNRFYSDVHAGVEERRVL